LLERLEVYPYQRVAEPKARNRRNIKRELSDALKKRFYNREGFSNSSLIDFIKAITALDTLLLGMGVLIMSRAFVLGELLPFVFAYVTAFGYRNKTRSIFLVLCAAAGFLTVLNGVQLWTNILVLCFLTGIISYINIPEEKIWWRLPVLTISIILAAKSLVVVINGVSFYAEMVVIFEALISGILTLVFIVANDVVKQRKHLVNFCFEDIAAFLVLGVGIVMGLSGIHFIGLSISSILCRFGILIAAFLWGSGGGCMVGVMCGIIPSISSPIFVPSLGMYALSGILAGLFKNFSRLGVIIGFMLGTLAFSMFISETQEAILGIWETGIACLAFCLLPGNLIDKVPVQSLGPITNLKEADLQNIDTRIRETARSRIKHLADVFEELSCTFTDETKLRSKAHETAYLNYLYNEISYGFCESCSRYDICWGQNCYQTSQEIMDIFTIAETSGAVSFEECPADFKRNCIYGREMVTTINYLFDNLRINEYWLEKLDESRDLVGKQLKGAGKIIKELADEINIKAAIDFTVRDKLIAGIKRMGLNIKEITPVKTNGEQLYINVVTDSCPSGNNCDINIAPAISSLVGENLEVCDKKCPCSKGKGQCEFTLTKVFTYRVASGAAQVGKEQICGDSFTISTLKEGKELIALSDGMGVGEKACSESQAAVRLLENLLNSGFQSRVALNTINSVLMLKSTSDTFATIDMVMIDLYTAEVDFIKIGSAPSFIKRGKRVGVITSNSLPIGILDNIDIVSEKRALCAKDMLVLVSDGVLEISRGVNDSDWIPGFLEAIDEKDPQLVAEMILNKALILCNGKPNDDMTVICINIDYA
jgi:stage II sporulation protein E